ncbi:hypothetical protein Tdes44962_MAKER00612 [Teratosphaeria destructans]|uniref:AA1-like domain-containing protein n=1 Tax=Teratosphaeria destructans TaxID=418781 RepID=A0A9W7W0E1_9PEZI|nr:hypothetical protein Tdes44962_MAKER00612 [Teratosphaeria destructans]
MLSHLALTTSALALLAASVSASTPCGPEYGINQNTGLWDCYYWDQQEYVGREDGKFTFDLTGEAESGLPAFAVHCEASGGTSDYHPCKTISGPVKAAAYLTPVGALAEGLGTLHIKIDFGDAVYSCTDPNVSFNDGQSPPYGKGFYPDTKEK